jgi:hypothetical protein
VGARRDHEIRASPLPSTRCRAASFQASAKSPLRAPPTAPAAVSRAGHLMRAMRSPCFRDARHVQREAESTRGFRVVRRTLCRSIPFCCLLRQGSPASPQSYPAIEGKIKGAALVGGKASRNQSGTAGPQFCTTCRLLEKDAQVQRTRRHHAAEQSKQSDRCASPRAFRSFLCRVRASMIPSTPMVAAVIADHKPNSGK